MTFDINQPRYQGLKDINLESLAFWFNSGFFLNGNGFLNDEKNYVDNIGPFFKWHDHPEEISFEKIVWEFTNTFDEVIAEATKGRKIILPISGGLDSRTIAASLIGNKNVVAYSYEFENGIPETKYAKEIASALGWEFFSFKIPQGYLWGKLDCIANLNNCMTEFTNPRQLYVINEISKLGDIIISGSMGDLLFDSFKISKNANQQDILNYAINLITKPGGNDLAIDLWSSWNLEDTFIDYANRNVKSILDDIDVADSSKKIRVFKIYQYVKYWTNINLLLFKKDKELFVPYHHNKICELVCRTPEKYLSNRKIQIEYIKNKSKELASIPWQKLDLNLYQYKLFNTIYFPRRIFRYSKRILLENFFNYPPKIVRNWELQFLGEKNDESLKDWLFENPKLFKIVPDEIIYKYYHLFKNVDPIKYSHPVSMLLTLSVWTKKLWNNK